VFFRLGDPSLHPVVHIPFLPACQPPDLFPSPLSLPVCRSSHVVFFSLPKFRLGAEPSSAGIVNDLFPQLLPPCSDSCRSRPSSLLGFGLLVRVLSIHVLVAVFFLPLASHSCPFLFRLVGVPVSGSYSKFVSSSHLVFRNTSAPLPQLGRLKCARFCRPPFFFSSTLPPCFNIACTVRSETITASKFEDGLNPKW